jgi:predicted dehydrogenase
MLNAAIVGLGWWGRNLAQLLQSSPKLRPSRAVDIDLTAAEWAQAHGLAFGTLEDVLADPAIGAVILCTPHSLHTAQIVRAATAGKHVFCEKPLALHRRDALAAVASCRENGVVLGIGHERRFEPPMLDVRRLARSGALGTLLQIEASFCQDFLLALPADNWRLDARDAPAGPLTATGVHMLDLAVSLLGPAERARASVRRLASELANGDTLAALVEFRGGAQLLLSAILATPFASRLMVYGSKGWVEVRDKAHPKTPEGWVLTTCRSGGRAVSVDYPAVDAVRRNLEAFADAAEGGAPYPVPAEEMVATVAAIEAIVTAASSERSEKVAG